MKSTVKSNIQWKQTLSELDRRMQGPITPNASCLTFKVDLDIKKKENLKAIIVAGWFLKEEIRTCLFLHVADYWFKYQQPDDLIELEVLLRSRVACYELICLQYSERDWFGNFQKKVIQARTSLRVLLSTDSRVPPRKKTRRRGYRDHGTLRPSHKWLPKGDWSLTELQLQIEEQRQIRQDSVNFISGFLE
jgi:hypothetical protein